MFAPSVAQLRLSISIYDPYESAVRRKLLATW
jgi:hypothetical protein